MYENGQSTVVDLAVEEFSPFVEVDLTGDRLVDVAAVVVQPGSPIRYGVVAFTGGWIRASPMHCHET
jgi:hypothetical protein